jgi:hypothetical protein
MRERRLPRLLCRLRNLILPDKFKPLGITKYDAKQDPVQILPRIFQIFLEFILIFLELFLFIRRI